jgi:spore germination protein GerM
VLDRLLAGVPAEADAEGIVTRIPADTALAAQPELQAGILSVDLDSGMSGIQGDGARLAYGQIVCTADALEGVEGVLFTIEGEPVQPPNGQGETGSAPLTCAAYDELRGG